MFTLIPVDHQYGRMGAKKCIAIEAGKTFTPEELNDMLQQADAKKAFVMSDGKEYVVKFSDRSHQETFSKVGLSGSLLPRVKKTANAT